MLKKKERANVTPPGAKSTLNNPQSVASPVSYKLKSKTTFFDQDEIIITYFYDERGRQTRAVRNDGSSVSIVWTTSIVTVTSYNTSNVESLKVIYNLGPFGRAISAKENSLKEEYTYEYDVNGYLMKTKVNYTGFSALNSVTTYTYYLNNLTRTLKADYFRSSTEDYEYYLNTRNTIGDENKGMNIFGRQGMNLVKTYTSNLPDVSGIDVIN